MTAGEGPTGQGRRAARPRPGEVSLDLAGLLTSRRVKVEIPPRETSPELQSRLRIEEAKAAHQLWKDKLILVVTLALLVVVAISCLVVAFRPGPSEDKKWAMSVLASIVSLGVGYLGGRAGKGD